MNNESGASEGLVDSFDPTQSCVVVERTNTYPDFAGAGGHVKFRLMEIAGNDGLPALHLDFA
jgi:hypothetical protein